MTRTKNKDYSPPGSPGIRKDWGAPSSASKAQGDSLINQHYAKFIKEISQFRFSDDDRESFRLALKYVCNYQVKAESFIDEVQLMCGYFKYLKDVKSSPTPLKDYLEELLRNAKKLFKSIDKFDKADKSFVTSPYEISLLKQLNDLDLMLINVAKIYHPLEELIEVLERFFNEGLPESKPQKSKVIIVDYIAQIMMIYGDYFGELERPPAWSEKDKHPLYYYVVPTALRALGYDYDDPGRMIKWAFEWRPRIPRILFTP